MNEKKSRPGANRAIKMVGRVIQYMLHYYKYLFLIVVACIIVTAIATVVGATFPQKLVDNYIMPMLESGSNDFSNLAKDLFYLACDGCRRSLCICLQPNYGKCESGNDAASAG